MALTFDGTARIIALDGSSLVSVRALYSEWVDWVGQGDNGKYLPALSTIADPPLVPVYATLLNGWRVRPLSTGVRYLLTIGVDGFLRTSEGVDPFVASGGVEPAIRFQEPVIAVGYETGAGTATGGFTATDRATLTQTRDAAQAAATGGFTATDRTDLSQARDLARNAALNTQPPT